MEYKEFVFENYRYDPLASVLSLYYRFSNGPRFEERVFFDFPPQQTTQATSDVLDRVYRLIFLLS